MTVMMVDKRRPGTGSSVLSCQMQDGSLCSIFQGMDRFVNTANFNDPLDVTPAKAKDGGLAGCLDTS